MAHLAVWLDPGAGGTLGISAQRYAELKAHGVISLDTADECHVGSSRLTPRAMLARLRAGLTTLLWLDGELLPATTPEALTVRLGRATVGLRRTPAWLAARADCAMLPVYIRPSGAGHTIVLGAPVQPARATDWPVAAQACAQWLFAQSVGRDPALWALWPTIREE